tara:strand:+ start:9793 stop:10215 length:423 start_codon:yes stop_codon:yes gene_type:complete
MRNTKTARGLVIDMAALAARHETTRAVGNVPMNARGDRLNQDGTVKVSAEEIAVAHQNTVEPPQQQPLSATKPITSKSPEPIEEPAEFAEPEVADLEEQFTVEAEAISKITRTREDGTKYVEIEYDDGSIETLEINIDEE